ncbi:MFS transporter [Gemmiger sp.]
METATKSTAAAGKSTVYQRAKLWQIILVSSNALSLMATYSLAGMASYSASVGYGIATIIVGYLLTGMRLFDAITDPLVALLYDRVNTRFGKVRPLMLGGWLVQTIGLLMMYIFCSGKGFGVIMFLVCYAIYILGYTVINMVVQTLPNLLTNDPKQRPMVGVWYTAFNYLVPTILSVVLAVVILPRAGGTYNQTYLTMACIVCVALSFVGVVLTCIGISEYDKPETFMGIGKHANEKLSVKDMTDVLMHNKPLRCLIVSAASDKLAQQTASQSIVTILISGILIGNMQMATILRVGAMLPSIVFAVLGARYAGKHGNKEALVTWTRVSAIVGVALIVFFAVIEPSSIAHAGPTMLIYILLSLAYNGCMMCVTTATTAFKADVADVELDRSGRYVPAVISGVYSLVDKIISSVSGLIATSAVALIGYTTTLPQPGDEATTEIFWVAMFLMYGLSIIGWICTLIAMRFCDMSKQGMEEIQLRIADKKAAALAAEAE